MPRRHHRGLMRMSSLRADPVQDRHAHHQHEMLEGLFKARESANFECCQQ